MDLSFLGMYLPRPRGVPTAESSQTGPKWHVKSVVYLHRIRAYHKREKSTYAYRRPLQKQQKKGKEVLPSNKGFYRTRISFICKRKDDGMIFLNCVKCRQVFTWGKCAIVHVPVTATAVYPCTQGCPSKTDFFLGRMTLHFPTFDHANCFLPFFPPYYRGTKPKPCMYTGGTVKQIFT